LGSTVGIAVFLFGEGYPYNAILVGPFGGDENYQEQLQMVKNVTERAGVPNAWMQVVLVGGDD